MESEITELLEEFDSIHYAPGPLYQRIQRYRALKFVEIDELRAIYHLVESHVPGLRLKTIMRYEKSLSALNDQNPALSLNKNHVDFSCANTDIGSSIDDMVAKLKEMPEEWTIAQITPHFNPFENLSINKNHHYTNSLHIGVFTCGQNFITPFVVTAEAPRDSVNGKIIELADELHAIVAENKETLSGTKSKKVFDNNLQKLDYFNRRQSTDDRLRRLVKDMQDLWLKQWRCLLVGKYINKHLDRQIRDRIKLFLAMEVPNLVIEQKNVNILLCLIKSYNSMTFIEIKRVLQYLFAKTDNSNVKKKVLSFIESLIKEFRLNTEKKHPIILILDDNLDCFPWEMIDVLQDESVSRVPSLHFLYALYKEHKDTIKDGYKTIKDHRNGTYVINPNLDLVYMENRITSFIEYWIPEWKGIVGSKPTESDFENMLTTGNIFSYSGHGSGTHFFSMEKIQKLRIEAVVLLFGCGSTKLHNVGPQTEMYGAYQMYMIACSPCIVGMLWEVTDIDTDMLTTEFMSQWIPSKAKHSWKSLDKIKWKKGEKIDFNKCQISTAPINNHFHEEKLLKALSSSKKSNSLAFYLTRAACIARGIPVKIGSQSN